jgi:hypothetical protein
MITLRAVDAGIDAVIYEKRITVGTRLSPAISF